jgi:hypothetical protein
MSLLKKVWPCLIRLGVVRVESDLQVDIVPHEVICPAAGIRAQA